MSLYSGDADGATLTDVEYPDTDVDSQARSRYATGHSQASAHAPRRPAVTVAVSVDSAPATPFQAHAQSPHRDSALGDDDEEVPPPLEAVPLGAPAASPHDHAQDHGHSHGHGGGGGGTPFAMPASPAPAALGGGLSRQTPEEFQAMATSMLASFRTQQAALVHAMSAPAFVAETDRLHAELPPAIQKDLAAQLAMLPEEMRVPGRGQLVRQAASWARAPNQSFLLLGVKRNNVALARMTLEELGADVDHVDEDGNCGLHWAAWYKIAPMAEYLVSRGANPNIRNSKGQTPLHWACMGGNLACVRVLVRKARAQLDVQDKDGYYPTHAAAQHGKTAVLEYLKLNGADLHARDGSNRTLLHWAAFKNELITAQYLVNQGLSLSVADTGGRLALHWAASQNNLDLVSYLVGVYEERMDGDFSALDAKDAQGLTPVEVARAKNAHKVIRYLTEVSARVRQSRFQKLFSALLCLSPKSVLLGGKLAVDTTKSMLGVYITIWFFAMLAATCLHHWLVVLPATPEEAVGTTLQRLLILGELVAAALWITVHKTNPGYLAKNLGAMKTAFDRGNLPGGSPVPSIASSPRGAQPDWPSRARTAANDDDDDLALLADENSSMIQMEEMGGKEPLSAEHFTYEQSDQTEKSNESAENQHATRLFPVSM